jgi:hypothetical protein
LLRSVSLRAMMVGVPITPSPGRGRGNKPEVRPGVEPSGRGGATPNLPALAGTPALQGGEEVRAALVVGTARTTARVSRTTTNTPTTRTRLN